jgi:hypothetical protein
MPLTVLWNVDFVIPAILNEVDRTVAGVISGAIAAPASGMAWWNTQIQGLILLVGMSVNNDRFTIDDARLRIRIVANVNAAIEARLPDADGYADIGRIYGGHRHQCCRDK